MLLTEGDLVWPTVEGVGDMPPLSADLVALAVREATEWLWALTGRQYGTRPATLRPQGARCVGQYPVNYLVPVSAPAWGGSWPYTADESRLTDSYVVELPGPVEAGSAVTPPSVDLYDTLGAHTTLAGAQLRVDGDYLVRQDGLTWPDAQDMLAPLGSPNTWAVTYSRGVPVPAMGQVAVTLLAAELGKLLAGAKKCAIPENATTVTRGGVTINRDVLKALVTTGVSTADRWVASTNPNGLAQEPMVWSPDVSRNGSPYRGSAQFHR